MIKRTITDPVSGVSMEITIPLTFTEKRQIYTEYQHKCDMEDVTALYGEETFTAAELDTIAKYKRSLEFENHLGWVDAVNTAINRLGWLNRIREIISDEDLARIA